MMIEQLEAIDRWLVLSINSWNTPFLDELMWLISGKLTWIPLYLLLIYLGYRKLDFRRFFIYFLCVIGSVVIADLLSATMVKEIFMRYRPSHNLLLIGKLHLYHESDGSFYDGGMYGFVSSHAANFFALAISSGLILRPYYPKLVKILLIIAVIICFSRIYLGVHYFSDLLGGAVLGSAVAWIIYRFVYLRFYPKMDKI